MRCKVSRAPGTLGRRRARCVQYGRSTNKRLMKTGKGQSEKETRHVSFVGLDAVLARVHERDEEEVKASQRDGSHTRLFIGTIISRRLLLPPRCCPPYCPLSLNSL